MYSVTFTVRLMEEINLKNIERRDEKTLSKGKQKIPGWFISLHQISLTECRSDGPDTYRRPPAVTSYRSGNVASFIKTPFPL